LLNSEEKDKDFLQSSAEGTFLRQGKGRVSFLVQ